MRNILLASFLSAAVALPSAAMAQETKSVDDYLCTFAGKCGDASAEAEVTKDAPDTKGFSLTKPSAPSRQPATRAFSLGKADAKAPAKAAPAKQMASKSTATKPKAAPAKSMALKAEKRGDLSLSFELGSAVLTPAARQNAKAFAEALMRPELASKKVMIEGHTDAQGQRDFNMELSKRRAQAVADYLTQLGVSSDRLEVKGFGPDKPRSRSASENRRVEAVLTS
jgi:outer membrane protein OmpA-like peptidoglycan-associated protein